MKTILVLVFFALSISNTYGQVNAITEKGEAVILFPDGTWKVEEKQKNEVLGFRKGYWGNTKEAIKKNETLELFHESDTALFYETSLNGIECSAIYVFAVDKLVRGRYYFKNEHTNNTDYINDFISIKELLIEKYGDPIDDQQVWKNNLYKADTEEWGMAIAAGHMFYYAIWENNETRIEIQLWGDNFEIRHSIDYTSKKYGNLENEIKQKTAIDEL